MHCVLTITLVCSPHTRLPLMLTSHSSCENKPNAFIPINTQFYKLTLEEDQAKAWSKTRKKAQKKHPHPGWF